MERIIADKLQAFLTTNSLISSHQYAYTKRKSCLTQLLSFTNEILSNGGKQVDVVYLDFAKAFDSAVHSKLIFKLENFGVAGTCLEWITSFLTNRFQCVKINGCTSDLALVISGVPQGSVLGPLLFLIYINDALDRANDHAVTTFAFADDVKSFISVNTVVDCSKLQSNLNEICTWANTWQLSLASDKCKLLRIRSHVDTVDYKYDILGTELEMIDSITDLGVIFDANLNFSKHIQNLCQKARCSSQTILDVFILESRNCSFVLSRHIQDPSLNIAHPFGTLIDYLI